MNAVIGKTPCLVWICRGDERYGVATAIVNFSVCLEKQGWNIVVVGVKEGSFLEYCREMQWMVVSLNSGNLPKAVTGNILSRIFQLAKSQRKSGEIAEAALQIRLPAEQEIIAVQTFNMLLLGPVSKLAKKFNAVGVWRMPTHIRPRRPINYTRIFMQYRLWATRILAMGTSNFTTNSLGKGPALLSTNAHGINTEKFNPATAAVRSRTDFGISEDSVVFIIAAQLYSDNTKGQLTFAKALSRVKSSESPMHLLLLGGPSDGALAEQIRELERSANVAFHFTGPVKDVENYYALADIAVSARLAPEPFGLSVVEAMLMQKPVLAHASGGPAEIVDDSITGWHSQSAEISDFVGTINRCLSDKSRWNQMGRKAREVALARYSIEAECERWKDAIRKHTSRNL